MESKIMPVIVTTLEALYGSIDDGAGNIYIDGILFSQVRKEAEEILKNGGYTSAVQPGKHGVFFIRCQESNGLEPDIHEIYDPLGIL